MPIIKLTAKRQATLPKALCDEMQIQPGDAIQVDRRVLKGDPVWVLTPADRMRTDWFGALKSYAQGKRHDMDSIRKSVGKARQDGRI